jgi:hypothetical protein
VSLHLTVSPDIDLNKNSLKEYYFNHNKSINYYSTTVAQKNFKKIVNSIKKGKIFFGDTKVKFNGDFLKEDELVAITTNLILNIYSTSYVRVSTLYETDEYFQLCLSSCEENIIDGYYRIKITCTGTTIQINYTKVLSPIPTIIKLYPKQRYIDINTKSVTLTVNELFNLVD